MFTSKFKDGKIRTRTDFVETVKSIPKGEVHCFNRIGTVYTGLTTACSRLKSSGYDFKVKSDNKTDRIYIHRLK